jgi:hypothetical protein
MRGQLPHLVEKAKAANERVVAQGDEAGSDPDSSPEGESLSRDGLGRRKIAGLKDRTTCSKGRRRRIG